MSKIAIVGAGQVGATAALYCAQQDIADVVMVDVVEGLARGKALDIMEAAPVLGFGVQVEGSEDFSALSGADVVIHTAGIPRKPGMERMDLLKTNVSIARDVSHHMKTHCPDARVVVVANPLDVICMAVLRASGFSPARIIGQAGVLDSARFRYFVAEKLDVRPEDVSALVLGGHGDQMVPLTGCATVGGVPLTELLDEETIAHLVQRTRTGGGEIVKHLKTGSAFYAPAASAVQMASAIVTDQSRIVGASAWCSGQYGMRDMFLGVPVMLGKNGVEKIIEIELAPKERAALQESADAVKKGISTLDSIS